MPGLTESNEKHADFHVGLRINMAFYEVLVAMVAAGTYFGADYATAHGYITPSTETGIQFASAVVGVLAANMALASLQEASNLRKWRDTGNNQAVDEMFALRD